MNAEFFYEFARGSLIPNSHLMGKMQSQWSSWTTAQSITWTMLNSCFMMQIYSLPPYSPDINPIEHTFSKVKNSLVPRPFFEEEEEKGPGTHYLRMRQNFRKFFRIIFLKCPLPRGSFTEDMIRTSNSVSLTFNRVRVLHTTSLQ